MLLAWGPLNDYRATTDAEGMTVLQIMSVRFGGLPLPPPTWVPTLAQLDASAAQLQLTANTMRALYGSQRPNPLRVPWGFVNRAVVGGREVPMPGGTKELPALYMAYGDPGTDGRMRTDKGSHLMQVSSLDASGLTVLVTTSNGQVDEALFPSSPHVGQTIDDFAARTYRRVGLSRDEVLAHPCPHGAEPGHEHPVTLTLNPGDG